MRGACLLALMLLTTAGIGVVIKRLYWSSFEYNFKMHILCPVDEVTEESTQETPMGAS